MIKIAPSILSADFADLGRDVERLSNAGADFIHIDVMDGLFVESFTNEIMEEYCKYIKSISNIPLDIHLMVKDVKKYIDIYLNYEPNIITFHIEAVKNEKQAIELINYIKSNNCKVGIAINPNTDISKIYNLLKYIHMVTIMTVEPGKGGQALIPETLNKIEELKNYIEDNNIEIDIEADGGIQVNNIQNVKTKGANIIVSGSGIINSDNYGDTIKKMKEEI